MNPQSALSTGSATAATWVIKPAIATQVLMAVIGLPFIALAVWATIEEVSEPPFTASDLLMNAMIFLLGAVTLTWVASVRIHISPERLWLRRFWRTQWTIRRADAELVRGGVGDGAILPGLRVIDRETRRKVGEILASQFRPADLRRLEEVMDQASTVSSAG